MKLSPMAMASDLILETLAGRKSQTRRLMKVQPPGSGYSFSTILSSSERDTGKHQWIKTTGHQVVRSHAQTFSSPFGHAGDSIYIREACKAEELPNGHDGVRYLSDNYFRFIENSPEAADQWTELNAYRGKTGAVVPSIHMPKWAARLFLDITNLRVERLHDISESDAEAEGIDFLRHLPGADQTLTAKQLFKKLWISIYGKQSWDANPYVWVIEFIRSAN